jgi:hypothetical protein
MQELCQKIMAGSYNAPDWLSPAAKDLLARMLTVDPERRITLAEVAAHPWTRGSGPAWEMPTVNCYSAPPVVQGPSGAGEAGATARHERNAANCAAVQICLLCMVVTHGIHTPKLNVCVLLPANVTLSCRGGCC